LCIFSDILWGDYDALLKAGKIEILDKSVEDAYISEVHAQSVLPKDLAVDKNVKIVYTPLHGAGLKPVMRVLKEEGFENIIVCKE